MSEKRSLTRVVSRRYQKAGKREKSTMLEEFVFATGYHRTYAAFLLSHYGKAIRIPVQGVATWVRVGASRTGKRRRRDRVYGEKVQEALTKVWYWSGNPCGKYLKVLMPVLVPCMITEGVLEVEAETEKQLREMSASTIDRLLSSERKRTRFNGRCRKKRIDPLRKKVAVHTWSEWDREKLGEAQVDLVAHDGGVARGDYIQTLSLVAVCTGWVGLQAVQNKAQRWVLEALQSKRESFPFVLTALHGDNGTEFLNHPLLRYSEEHNVRYTRGRPYQKNDQSYVEQKNGSVVREVVGYNRYATEAELQVLNLLYAWVEVWVNFFQPSVKLREKYREGSQIKKRYDSPQTPYQRLLDHSDTPASVKSKLRKRYKGLNPVKVRQEIVRLQRELETAIKS